MAVNQLLVQIDLVGLEPDMVLLTLGHASPPPLLGSVAEQQARLEEIDEVRVQPMARVALSKKRLAEWVNLLQRTATRIAELEAAEETEA